VELWQERRSLWLCAEEVSRRSVRFQQQQRKHHTKYLPNVREFVAERLWIVNPLVDFPVKAMERDRIRAGRWLIGSWVLLGPMGQLLLLSVSKRQQRYLSCQCPRPTPFLFLLLLLQPFTIHSLPPHSPPSSRPPNYSSLISSPLVALLVHKHLP